MQGLATQLVSKKVDVGSTAARTCRQYSSLPKSTAMTLSNKSAGHPLVHLTVSWGRVSAWAPSSDTVLATRWYGVFFRQYIKQLGDSSFRISFLQVQVEQNPTQNMCWAWFKRDCDTFLKPTGPSPKKWVFIQSPTGPALGQPWRGRGLVLQQHHWQLKVRQWLQLQLKEQPRNSPVVCPCCQQPSCEHPEISVFFWGWGQVVFLVAFSFENHGTRSVYVGFGWRLLRLKCWGRTCQQRGRKVRTHSWVRRVEVPQTALSKSYEAVDFHKSPSGWYQGFFRLQTMISWSSVILHSQSQSLSSCFRSKHSACFFLLRLSIFPGKTEKATTPAAVRSPADAQCYWVTQSLCQCVTSTD